MSASEKAAETAVNVVADVAEEVSDRAENFAEYARRLNKAKVKFYLLGMAIGGATGAVIAYKVAYSRAETKYSKIVDEEISEMRQHYLSKEKASEAKAAKRPVEEIVRERGYAAPETSASPPMAMQPPASVTVNEDEAPEEPPENTDDPQVRNLFEEAKVEHEWDWHEERRRRSPDIPYVIHYDERDELEYQSVTLTYYEGDDVLCNDRDEIVDPDERDNVVGDNNLNRFGHGSNDPSIVYIRNDRLELVYEVIKSPNHFAEEVHGFHHSLYNRNLERMRARERDEQEE